MRLPIKRVHLGPAWALLAAWPSSAFAQPTDGTTAVTPARRSPRFHAAGSSAGAAQGSPRTARAGEVRAGITAHSLAGRTLTQAAAVFAHSPPPDPLPGSASSDDYEAWNALCDLPGVSVPDALSDGVDNAEGSGADDEMVANSLMRTLRQYPYGPTAAADMKALLWSRLYRGASLADASSSLVALHQHRYPCAEGGDPSFALQAADCVRQYREGSHERREFHAGVMAAAQGELGAVIRADLTAAGARVLVSQADLIAYPQADVKCVDDANRFPDVVGGSLDWAGFRHSAYCTASMVAQLNACAQAVRPGGTISISLHYSQIADCGHLLFGLFMRCEMFDSDNWRVQFFNLKANDGWTSPDCLHITLRRSDTPFNPITEIHADEAAQLMTTMLQAATLLGAAEQHRTPLCQTAGTMLPLSGVGKLLGRREGVSWGTLLPSIHVPACPGVYAAVACVPGDHSGLFKIGESNCLSARQRDYVSGDQGTTWARQFSALQAASPGNVLVQYIPLAVFKESQLPGGSNTAVRVAVEVALSLSACPIQLQASGVYGRAMEGAKHVTDEERSGRAALILEHVKAHKGKLGDENETEELQARLGLSHSQITRLYANMRDSGEYNDVLASLPRCVLFAGDREQLILEHVKTRRGKLGGRNKTKKLQAKLGLSHSRIRELYTDMRDSGEYKDVLAPRVLLSAEERERLILEHVKAHGGKLYRDKTKELQAQFGGLSHSRIQALYTNMRNSDKYRDVLASLPRSAVVSPVETPATHPAGNNRKRPAAEPEWDNSDEAWIACFERGARSRGWCVVCGDVTRQCGCST